LGLLVFCFLTFSPIPPIIISEGVQGKSYLHICKVAPPPNMHIFAAHTYACMHPPSVSCSVCIYVVRAHAFLHVHRHCLPQPQLSYISPIESKLPLSFTLNLPAQAIGGPQWRLMYNVKGERTASYKTPHEDRPKGEKASLTKITRSAI
jgi:hypothetical protein